MKIVIYGLSKSGTSALFYKVRNSLPPGTISLFEPARYGPRERLRERMSALRRGHIAPSVLAKVLPWDSKPVRVRDFDGFDRKVVLVRDPRDRLVSDLLYRSYNASFVRGDSAAGEFLALLRRKEDDPASISVLDLFRTFDALERAAGSPSCWLERYRDHGVARPLQFHAERPQLPIFRYEQLVDGCFETLEAILRLPLAGSATLPPILGRVVRTKGYGAWRNWFTPADVAELRPMLQPYLDRYYPAADWDLSQAPALDPSFGSRYVERVINERRASWGVPPLPNAV